MAADEKAKCGLKKTDSNTCSFYSVDEFFVCNDDVEYGSVKCL